MESKEKEIWKAIDGYEGKYEISNLGRVKSLNYKNTFKEKILEPRTTEKGYEEIQLWNNYKQKHFKIHRLVASAFLPNENNYKEVNHINHIRNDNHVSNLEWCDRQYNNSHKINSK